MTRLVRVPGLASVPYAYAALAPPGAQLAFLAGSCPLDADGTTVGVGDVRAQAEQCVANLRATLGALGEHDAPSTLLGVTALGWPDQLVEIEAVAAVPVASD